MKRTITNCPRGLCAFLHHLKICITKLLQLSMLLMQNTTGYILHFHAV